MRQIYEKGIDNNCSCDMGAARGSVRAGKCGGDNDSGRDCAQDGRRCGCISGSVRDIGGDGGAGCRDGSPCDRR